MNAKTLHIAGAGIKSISHLSFETIKCIENADIVIYLLNEPVLSEWIEDHSRKAFSLEEIYFSSNNRRESYRMISEHVVNSFNTFDNVCLLLYGHPLVFSDPAFNCIEMAKRSNVRVNVLPAISAADCLYADLGIDPGKCGTFFVGANDLLIYDKKIHPDNYNIIWQIGSIGNIGPPPHVLKEEHLLIFKNKLLEIYNEAKEIILYEASLYPTVSPTINRFEIANLEDQQYSSLSTIIIPPETSNPINRVINESLGSLC